jgi:two-component system KDP operon response regulator KdpE
MHGKKVLIVDDDADVLEFVEHLFADVGAQVRTAINGREGLSQFASYQPDLVLLDVMMPALNGWQTCRHIRRYSNVPIIFLTAVSQEEDVVRGLDYGAIDYVTKPFNPRVLLARARAALRAVGAFSEGQPITHYDDGYLSVDLEAQQVSVGGVPVQLTDTEYGLFACLFENAGRVVMHREILEQVWGWGYEDAVDYLHVYVYHLRRKLEPDPSRPRYVHTHRGVGYRLDVQPCPAQELV